jgi:DNA modification methylase
VAQHNKPVDLLRYLIETYTQPGDTVIDFVAGSGSTLVAASQAGRNAIGIEREELFCHTAAQRLQGAQRHAEPEP